MSRTRKIGYALVLILIATGIVTVPSRLDAATEPSPRYLHAMAFDPVSGGGVLFGGFDETDYLADTWSWNGVAWTEKNPANSPSDRSSMATVFDPLRAQVVGFGGNNGGSLSNETWVWNGLNWTERNPASSPPQRTHHATAYDPVRGQVVLFGGINGAELNDTWVWDGTNWAQKSPTNKPTAREYHKMAFDPVVGEIVLFGGRRGGTILDDTWTWNGSNWTQESPLIKPSGRFSHAMSEDHFRGNVVLFGGYDGARLDDTWLWTGATWVNMPTASTPTRRNGHTMFFDPLRAEVMMFGGDEGTKSLNDVWGWNGVAWVERTPVPLPTPSPTLPPTPSPLPSPTIPPTPTIAPFEGYPSDGCDDGDVVADGFADGTYVKVRTDQPDADTTSVCVAADGAGRHLGGRVDIGDADISGTPSVVSDNACTSLPLLAGEIGDPGDPATHVPYEISVDVHPEEVWVCVSIDGTNRRVIVPVPTVPTVNFLGDETVPHPGIEEPPSDGLLPSSTCQTNGGDAVVNADVGPSSHVWLYTWQESSTRAHACVRGEGPIDLGGRLTIDTSGSPGVTPQIGTFTDQASQCNLNVFTNAEPVALSIRRSSTTNPAWVCVDVEGTQRQVMLGAQTGPQGIVTFMPDP